MKALFSLLLVAPVLAQAPALQDTRVHTNMIPVVQSTNVYTARIQLGIPSWATNSSGPAGVTTPIAIADGGTASTNAPSALLSLGAVQNLTSYAALATASPITGPDVAVVEFSGSPDLIYRYETVDPGFGWPLVATNSVTNFWVARPSKLNVFWFGAIPGDGVSDTVAIQAAVNAARNMASTGPQTVFLPEGEYTIEAGATANCGITLTDPDYSNLTIEGVKGLSVLKIPDGNSDLYRIIGAFNSYAGVVPTGIVIRGLKFDVNAENIDSGANVGSVVIDVDDGTEPAYTYDWNMIVEDCEFVNLKDHAVANYGSTLVRRCSFDGARKMNGTNTGIVYAGYGCDKTCIEDCYFSNLCILDRSEPAKAMYLGDGKFASVRNNTFHDVAFGVDLRIQGQVIGNVFTSTGGEFDEAITNNSYGIIIGNHAVIASGSILEGVSYITRGAGVTYNSVSVAENGVFVGVAGVTTYTGTGTVYPYQAGVVIANNTLGGGHAFQICVNLSCEDVVVANNTEIPHAYAAPPNYAYGFVRIGRYNKRVMVANNTGARQTAGANYNTHWLFSDSATGNDEIYFVNNSSRGYLYMAAFENATYTGKLVWNQNTISTRTGLVFRNLATGGVLFTANLKPGLSWNAGAPASAASIGSVISDTTNGKLYVNEDSTTTGWAALLGQRVSAQTFVTTNIIVTAPTMKVIGNAGAATPVTVSETGAFAGQIVTILGDPTISTETVEIVDTTVAGYDLQLAGGAACVLGANDTLMLLYSGAAWVELGRSDN